MQAGQMPRRAFGVEQIGPKPIAVLGRHFMLEPLKCSDMVEEFTRII
jgi:hypothetical protein